MDITTPFLSVQQLGLVPLIMALVQVPKMAGLLGSDNRYAPITSVVFGVAVTFLLPSATWQMTVLAGLTLGCLAAGVYSGIKTTVTSNA